MDTTVTSERFLDLVFGEALGQAVKRTLRLSARHGLRHVAPALYGLACTKICRQLYLLPLASKIFPVCQCSILTDTMLTSERFLDLVFGWQASLPRLQELAERIDTVNCCCPKCKASVTVAGLAALIDVSSFGRLPVGIAMFNLQNGGCETRVAGDHGKP